MKLSLEIAQSKNACSDGIIWYKYHGEPDTVESCVEQLIADTKCSEHLNYANWLLSEMLSLDDKVQYAIFAAEQVLEIFEKARPDRGV